MARKTHRKKVKGKTKSIGMIKRLTLKIKSLFGKSSKSKRSKKSRTSKKTQRGGWGGLL